MHAAPVVKDLALFLVSPALLFGVIMSGMVSLGVAMILFKKCFNPLMDLTFGKYKPAAYGFLVGIPLLSAFMALIGIMLKKVGL